VTGRETEENVEVAVKNLVVRVDPSVKIEPKSSGQQKSQWGDVKNGKDSAQLFQPFRKRIEAPMFSVMGDPRPCQSLGT
jgi:hypothetical protein